MVMTGASNPLSVRGWRLAMPAKPDPKKMLDDHQDFPVSPAWLQEDRRRCADLDSGKAELIENSSVINA
jgi:hypothetical protein